MKTLPSSCSTFTIGLASLLALASPALLAVDYNNGGGDQFWGNDANWTAAHPDGADTSARMVSSGIGANQRIQLADAAGDDASFTIGTLTIGFGGGAPTHHYQVNNVADGTGRLIFQRTSGNAVLNFKNIFANATMSINVGSTLNSNLTVNVERATGTHFINGSIESGTAGTGVTYNVVTNGLLTLTAANTYTGATNVTNGRIALSSTGSIASESALVVAAGAVFDVSAKSSYTFGSGGINLAVGETTAGFIQAGSADVVFGNTLTLDLSGTEFAESYNLFDFGGQTGDFGAVNLTGSVSGSLLLSSADTWTGTLGDYEFNFSETTGVLSIGAATIPEPSAAALIGGLAVLGVAFGRSRRRG